MNPNVLALATTELNSFSNLGIHKARGDNFFDRSRPEGRHACLFVRGKIASAKLMFNPLSSARNSLKE